MDIKSAIGIVAGVGALIFTTWLADNALAKSDTHPTIAATPEPPERSYFGVGLSVLNEIARQVGSRDYCTIDKDGRLWYTYASNRGHQFSHAQMRLDENLRLYNFNNPNGSFPYPGQRYSHENDFLKRVNETIQFTK